MRVKIDHRDLATNLNLVDLYLGKNHAVEARNVLDRARKAFRGKRFLKDALAVEEKILGLAPDDFRAQVSLWAYFLSFFISPVPHRHAKKG